MIEDVAVLDAVLLAVDDAVLVADEVIVLETVDTGVLVADVVAVLD